MSIEKVDPVRSDVAELAARLGRDRGALLPILQEVRSRHAVVSDRAMAAIAVELGLRPAEVFGVASFHQLLGRPGAKTTVKLCRTVACDLAGKAEVARALEETLGIRFGQTTPDGRISLQWADCLGLCDQGPALLVDDFLFARMTAAEARELVAVCRRSANEPATGVADGRAP